MILSGKLLPKKKFQIISKPHKELEELIQYIVTLRERGEQEKIIHITQELSHLLTEDLEPDKKQILHLLLDYLSGEDISHKIKELDEPFKSLFNNM